MSVKPKKTPQEIGSQVLMAAFGRAVVDRLAEMRASGNLPANNDDGAVTRQIEEINRRSARQVG